MDEVEAVARAICATRGLSPDALYQHHEWEPWPIDRRDEYVGLGGEVRINLMHYAWRHHTERAQAAIAALDAARGKAEPVAWMYHHPGDIEHGWQRYEFRRRIQSYEGMSCIEEDAGMIETPLYAHPPAPDAARGDPVARVVEFIREQQANADKHMREAARRLTESHFAAAFVTLRNLADAIERGEPFNP